VSKDVSLTAEKLKQYLSKQNKFYFLHRTTCFDIAPVVLRL